YRLLDLDAVREAAGAALYLKVEPVFGGVDVPVELPDLGSMGGRWHRYLDGQDLTGFDRDRIKALGDAYLSNAVESAG
ncbi:MAG TPA: hypothetical protein VM263_06115, partial [Acidimicrobiales bacterium]|nr:hypothetical protein [Acidimicrobiales bacterium]